MQALKTLLIILFVVAWTSSYGQLDKFKGVWITSTQELLQIKDTGDLKNENYLSNSNLSDENFELYIYGDTLSFQKRYYSSATNYKKLYVDKYDLKIIKSNDTSIIARPVSSFSRKFFLNSSKLTFVKQALAIDTSIKFDKIIFHTSECFGTCSAYHLQVDNSKQVKLNSQIVYKSNNDFQPDTASSGYYIGQLSDTTFEKLTKAMQTCNLPTLKMNDVLCCDGSIITIIVYFNGQRKYFKTMRPPTIANELIEVLYSICAGGDLTKIKEKFILEK